MGKKGGGGGGGHYTRRLEVYRLKVGRKSTTDMLRHD